MNFSKATKEFIRAIFSHYSYSLKRSDVLFFSHDVHRSICLNGKAYSPLIDSLREELEAKSLNCQSILQPWSFLSRNKIHGESLNLNFEHLRIRILNKLQSILGNEPLLIKNPYKNIIKISNARLVISIGSTTELALAAREAGVFHVELLHGVGYTQSVLVDWGWLSLKTEHLPQGILSLDDVSTAAFSTLAEKSVEIRTIPHPFLKRFTPKKFDSLPVEWKIKHLPRGNYSKRILVALNWGYAGDHGVHTQFADILPNGLFYQEIAELVKEESDIFWHFRFHPLHLRRPSYRHLLQFMDDFVALHNNSDWRSSSWVPFPTIAASCDSCICMSSMACYDSAAIGLHSLMLCPTIQKGSIYQERFNDLEDEGFIVKARANKATIRNWVRQAAKGKPRLSNLEDDSAWQDAVEWMLQRSGLHELGRRQVGK